MIKPADHQPFQCDTGGEGHEERGRNGEQDRQGVIRHEELDDVAGIGAHHDEFAMRHVDDTHHTKGDGKTDGSEEIDRSQR